MNQVAVGGLMSFNRENWPSVGPVRQLLEYIDELHTAAGAPAYRTMARSMGQRSPSRLHDFATRGRLLDLAELLALVTYLRGDPDEGRRLQRLAMEWNAGVGAVVVAVEGAHLRGLDIVVHQQESTVPGYGTELVGRAEVIDRALDGLRRRSRVLLHGMGGMGKTSLASAAARRWIAHGGGRCVWITVGSADATTILDALATRVGTAADRRGIATAAGHGRALLVQRMLTGFGVTLLVVDGAEDGAEVATVLKAVPAGIAVLVTSRRRHVIDVAIPVASMPPAEAQQLLAHSAREPGLRTSAAGRQLCRMLGHHPFAIRIAGVHLRHYGIPVAEFERDFSARPHAASMPEGADTGGSVMALLDASWDALNPRQRSALVAFGAFSGRITAPLLAAYLDLPVATASEALRALTDVSLAERDPASSSYAVHDLTLAYVRDRTIDRVQSQLAELPSTTATAVLAVVRSSTVDNQTLRADILNILSAADDASIPRAQALEILYGLAQRRYFDDCGHTAESLTLLARMTAPLDVVPGEHEVIHHLLSKLGNGYYDHGRIEEAEETYRRALELTDDPHRRAVMHGLLGKALAGLDRFAESDAEFARAVTLAEQAGEAAAETVLVTLEHHSVALADRGDHQQMKQVCEDGLVQSRRISAEGRHGRVPVREYEVVFLNNLGTAEFRLGIETARAHHEQAQRLAEEIGYEQGAAVATRSLAADFLALERYPDGLDHYVKALRRYEQLGRTARIDQLTAQLRQLRSLADNILKEMYPNETS